jgi:hypothetical protein
MTETRSRTYNLHLWLSDGERRAIEDLARHRGFTVSQMLRVLIRAEAAPMFDGPIRAEDDGETCAAS